MPLRNCLNRPVSRTRATEKCSGAKLGMRGKLDRLVDVQRVADPHVGGVDQADDVAGPRLLDRLPLLAEHRVGVLGGERLAGRPVGDDHPPLEPARAHPQERDAVAVRPVHVRLHLEHEARERRVEAAAACRRRPREARGAGARSTTASSSSRTPKLVSAEPKNVGDSSPPEEQLLRRGRRRRRRAGRARRRAGPRRALLVGGPLAGRRSPPAPRWRRGRCG